LCSPILNREMAAEALVHYKRGNRWKAIFENIIRWRKVKLVGSAPVEKLY